MHGNSNGFYTCSDIKLSLFSKGGLPWHLHSYLKLLVPHAIKLVPPYMVKDLLVGQTPEPEAAVLAAKTCCCPAKVFGRQSAVCTDEQRCRLVSPLPLLQIQVYKDTPSFN